MKNFPVQFTGTICWLPTHRPGKIRFPPAYKFLAAAKFTSDFSAPDMDAVVSYSPFQESSAECYKVRLYFRLLEGREDEIRRLAKNTEILIMDAYKVIAVCRNISLSESKQMMDDEWSA
jgi:hypothetical protein